MIEISVFASLTQQIFQLPKKLRILKGKIFRFSEIEIWQNIPAIIRQQNFWGGMKIEEKIIWNVRNVDTAWGYSQFHKILPISSLPMHWISVRFYEMGDILLYIYVYPPPHSPWVIRFLKSTPKRFFTSFGRFILFRYSPFHNSLPPGIENLADLINGIIIYWPNFSGQ